ncbi:DDE_Tnp_IS1595 domain-containing protein [Trichonephila clavipes]|uniref:DDE_Tnp_IS1595 domain-containing protein n=1 Tax=Trichonephila clavipes TaxID=2585209 RepID=A0A8X6RMW5_TRICX|nr:DDE_Tnp_IS1595 domain-containing protein [Trichonephila clavipes]
MLRGPDVIVEIDETMFGKRKYSRDKHGNETWVFRGIERSSNKCFSYVLQNRSKNTLLLPIRNNIKEGTAVILDCWKAYCCLQNECFLHLSVNRSLHFKDPEMGTHTNSIESSWSAIKVSDCLRQLFFEKKRRYGDLFVIFIFI